MIIEAKKTTLILQLQQCAKNLNRVPNAVDIKQASERGIMAHPTSFTRTFGSLEQAYRDAGLYEKQTEEVLLKLKELTEILGRTPRREHIEQHMPFSLIKRHFGTLNKALAAAGFTNLYPGKEERKAKKRNTINQALIYAKNNGITLPKLPENQLEVRQVIPQSGCKLTVQDYVSYFVEEMTAQNPDVIGPVFLKKTSRLDYYGLRYLLQQKVKPEADKWDEFVNLLPSPWQKKWIKQKTSPATLEECIALLVKRLEEEKPAVFYPAWIRKNISYVDFRLRQLPELIKVRNGKKSIDWDKFQDNLPAPWKSRWKLKKIGITEEPELYSDPEEFMEIFRRYESKLYILFLTLGPKHKEKELQKKMLEDFVKLAQKGNEEIVELLTKDLKIICQGWIEDSTQLKNFRSHYYYRLEQIIRRSIFSYQKKAYGDFYSFLYGKLNCQSQLLLSTLSLTTYHI